MCRRMRKSILAFSFLTLLGFGVCAEEPKPGAAPETEAPAPGELNDVIARVGDQEITFG
jgi:hypothetical protein